MTTTSRKQRTRTDFMALTISAGAGRLETSDGLERYRYAVTITSDATGAVRRFTYHDSAARRTEGVDHLDRESLLYAFWSFTSDAAAGAETFADFAADFGYDTDSYAARRTHAACRDAARKFADLWHDAERFTPSYVLEQLAAIGVE